MTRVAVLFGGISAEREVSLATGAQVIGALEEKGFAVVPVEVTADLGALVASLTPAPDAVFNALHGRFGEDGTIQGVLDYLGIPYTHSGLRASALAMDKAAAKASFAAAGLPVVPHRIVGRDDLAEADPLPRPYVLKPVNEGSSVGVFILHEGDNRRAEIAAKWAFGSDVMAEEFVPGRELTVAVLEDRALAVTEILAEGFYDYTAKYAPGASRHDLPARIPADLAARLKEIALGAHRALGCRGATRADFRYDEAAARIALLEVNTQPGMTATSLLPEQAAYCGIDFASLCAWMVERARCRA